MKQIEDLGKKMMTKLSEEKRPLEVEYLAYATGSTPTFIMREAVKLEELNVIKREGTLIQLNNQNNFNAWEKFKK